MQGQTKKVWQLKVKISPTLNSSRHVWYRGIGTYSFYFTFITAFRLLIRNNNRNKNGILVKTKTHFC